MDYDEWGVSPPWYEDFFFAICGIVSVCFIFVCVVIVALAVVVGLILGLLALLSLTGIVSL